MLKLNISIIMPVYNAEKTILKTLNSVLNQSFKNWELIIVDDASIDNTITCLKKINDERIIIIKNFKNQGPGICRDEALKKAKGKYIAFLDADDTWNTSFLEIYYKTIIEYQCDIVYGSYIMKNGNKSRIFQPEDLSLEQLYIQSPLSCLAVLIKSDIIGKCKFEGAEREDLHFWVQIIKRYNPSYRKVTSPLAHYIVSPQSRSGKKYRIAMVHANMLFADKEFSFPKKLKIFMLYILKGFAKYKL